MYTFYVFPNKSPVVLCLKCPKSYCVHASTINDPYDVQHGMLMHDWFDVLCLYGKWIMKEHGKPKSLSVQVMQLARMKPHAAWTPYAQCITHAALRMLITLKLHATMNPLAWHRTLKPESSINVICNTEVIQCHKQH